MNIIRIYIQYTPPFQPENGLENDVRIYYVQPKNLLNSSHDFIRIHIYGRKNEIMRIYTPETNNVDINTQPKNCLNGSHDFILIHIYGSKN